MLSAAELGKIGEMEAVTYLDRKGYRILERNYRCSFGEIDIIAEKDDTLCFIEVKTRRNFKMGMPAESVTRRKYQHLERCVYHYLSSRPANDRNIRIDVLEILYHNHRFYGRHLPGIHL